MGVSSDVIDLFEGNTVYSPVQQTKLVQALARMNGTADRGHFVKFAVLARNGNVAFFRARQAEMYANLHKEVTPVERFVGVGTNAATRLSNGTVVFCFPLDYLAWTEDNARLAESLDRQVSALPDVRGERNPHCWGYQPACTEGARRFRLEGAGSPEGDFHLTRL